MFDRRRLMLAAGAGLLPAPAWAQAVTPPEEPPIDQAALDVLPNLVTRMSVPVELNGGRRYNFVVDTGANRTALATEVADELGLARGPEVLVNGVTAAEPTPTALLPRLSVANVAFEDMVTPLVPRARLGVDGLLGVDVIGRFAVTFDVDAGQLRLNRRGVGLSFVEGRRLDGVNRLAARQRFGQLSIIDVRADEERVRAFIDSGSQYTIGNMALFRTLTVRRPEILNRRWTVPVIGATGQSVRGELAILRSIQLGAVTLFDLPVVFCDLHVFSIWRLTEDPGLIFGADMLRLFEQVTVDFPRSQVILGRPRTRRDEDA